MNVIKYHLIEKEKEKSEAVFSSESEWPFHKIVQRKGFKHTNSDWVTIGVHLKKIKNVEALTIKS